MILKKAPTIYFAPLQEFTDWAYRKSHSDVFGNIDKYFAPYINCQNDGTVKKSHLRDLAPDNKMGYRLVPQILAGNSKDFIFLAKLLTDLGYTEINWNLGCPYPMVTNKGQGSGLLPRPEKIDEILSESLPLLSCRISVKMRSGLLSPDEIFSVIPVLNKYPLLEIIFHPRIAKQLYRDQADPEIFIQAARQQEIPWVYNGDILSTEDFNNLDSLFQTQTSWMIGRGILKDPMLPGKIRKESPIQVKLKLFKEFHAAIFYEYSKLLSGKSHLLMRMLKFWSYFCYSFPDPHKTLKRIKKAGSLEKYDAAVSENFLRLDDNEKN